ncbi:2-oxo-4-hydroxy-4-carboxy-5-ureidoimidazoline decarboxylase [Acidicapsa dinghuensis]|uniref:2-oxo-4-hydroxy-4-carboxy-5-ureidoimidazoline decarboxylase n=1 Tax=Acidicapsa dinghuensis TaxID=2218256 RepID=A0ABW1EJL5_9BACT|nr:2-oxo-4-hydroxy-4-carboxy-5-ureidoimidazoline decarboxylase [Acidicapsa dinghuensis]
MRGNPATHELVAPESLSDVLAHLAAEPGLWTPISGGTELMVAFAAGRLNTPKLISLWGLSELSFIRVTDKELSIGGGVTFAQLRRHPAVASDFPLLAKAASWIGSIANQSRATIAGNIVNGSPAADAPPALLVYDAEIELISSSGTRRLPYANFHLGYKQSVLKPDELVLALHLPRRFAQHRQYLRKVGTRRAMAITKVALAASALIDNDIIEDIRLAGASVADRPVRLLETEAALRGKPLTSLDTAGLCKVLCGEIKPIDDIRSTAAYRRQVAANMLCEFLQPVTNVCQQQPDPSPILQDWNALREPEAIRLLTHCCASNRWAHSMLSMRPFAKEADLYHAADEVWSTMREQDWLEAFAAHPRIGERKAAVASLQSAAWSQQEQSSVDLAQASILSELAVGNALYEQQFGFIYIVCATEKSSEEMLAILTRRLGNTREEELREAAEQQRQITQIRLHKWLMGESKA